MRRCSILIRIATDLASLQFELLLPVDCFFLAVFTFIRVSEISCGFVSVVCASDHHCDSLQFLETLLSCREDTVTYTPSTPKALHVITRFSFDLGLWSGIAMTRRVFRRYDHAPIVIKILLNRNGSAFVLQGNLLVPPTPRNSERNDHHSQIIYRTLEHNQATFHDLVEIFRFMTYCCTSPARTGNNSSSGRKCKLPMRRPCPRIVQAHPLHNVVSGHNRHERDGCSCVGRRPLLSALTMFGRTRHQSHPLVFELW